MSKTPIDLIVDEKPEFFKGKVDFEPNQLERTPPLFSPSDPGEYKKNQSQGRDGRILAGSRLKISSFFWVPKPTGNGWVLPLSGGLLPDGRSLSEKLTRWVQLQSWTISAGELSLLLRGKT